MFWCYSDVNFCVFPDQKHILGVVYGNKNNVIHLENIEDFSQNNVMFTGFRDIIFSVRLNLNNCSFIVGESNLGQGRLTESSLLNRQITRDFGDIGVGYICAMENLGPFWFFGGSIGRVGIVNFHKKIRFSFKTAYKKIKALCVCRRFQSVFLVVCGEVSDFSSQSDIFDVSELFEGVFYSQNQKNVLNMGTTLKHPHFQLSNSNLLSKNKKLEQKIIVLCNMLKQKIIQPSFQQLNVHFLVLII